MIEQTELVVSKWQYHPPLKSIEENDTINGFISLDVMKKRAGNKKGIACRFNCSFVFETETILEYEAADSYVIDLQDTIDKAELQTMIRNSYSKFKETFDFKKLGTVLLNRSLMPFNDKTYDLDPVLLLLI